MKSYEDLRAWQHAEAIALEVFRWADGHWSPQRASALEQLRRASLSVALNIAEGFDCGPGPRCRFHLRVAYGSAVETTALLRFLTRLGDDLGDLAQRSEATRALTYRLWQNSRRS